MVPQEVVAQLGEVCRGAAAAYWGLPVETLVLEPSKVRPPFAEKMGMILVGHSAFRITLKLHYDSQSFSQTGSGKSGGIAVSAEEVVREALNQLGGRVRATIEAGGKVAALGLPVLTRGFDEVFSRPTDDLTCFGAVWRLHAAVRPDREPSKLQFIIGVLLEVSDRTALEALSFDGKTLQASSQEMELL